MISYIIIIIGGLTTYNETRDILCGIKNKPSKNFYGLNIKIVKLLSAVIAQGH